MEVQNHNTSFSLYNLFEKKLHFVAVRLKPRRIRDSHIHYAISLMSRPKKEKEKEKKKKKKKA